MTHYQDISLKGGWPKIPAGARMEVGYKDKRVRLLRERLKISGDLKRWNKKKEKIYDKRLAKAVARFQKRHGLPPGGAVGPWTLIELNVPVEERLRQIGANIKRMEGYPGELPESYLVVNIPDFQLYLIEKNSLRLKMKVIVGMPHWPTPLLSAEVTHLVVNPAWYIPKNIARKEVLPRIAEDPDYARRNNIRLIPVEGEMHLRQEPGPLNPLGRVKFQFPNPFDIFLHDTPAPELFERRVRALSHGCIRLENPIPLAQYFLGKDLPWTEKEKVIPLPKPVPIYLIYRTSWVDEKGLLHFRPDVYRKDVSFPSGR